MSLTILYHDEHVVAVHKPSGLLVHPSQVDRHATEFALHMLREKLGQHVFPVHRLDRATSGALVFALSSAAARALSEQFSGRTVEKHYLAVVRGVPPLQITIKHPLRELSETKGSPLLGKPPQEAITEIEFLASKEFLVSVDKYPTSRYSLVRAKPVTGRRHQIRRHLRHINCPIVGDVRYGKGKHNRFFESEFGIRRLLLACTEIAFKHPAHDHTVRIRSPLSAEFSALLKKLEWNLPA
jgi:tRNA pseudouridine65 synthase